MGTAREDRSVHRGTLPGSNSDQSLPQTRPSASALESHSRAPAPAASETGWTGGKLPGKFASPGDRIAPRQAARCTVADRVHRFETTPDRRIARHSARHGCISAKYRVAEAQGDHA